jgi:hypothetical protein
MPLDLTNIPAIVFTFGGPLNVGALAWWVRSGTDMKIAHRDATEAKRDAAEAKAKSTVLGSRVNKQDTIIIEIRTRMAKLDRADELVPSAKFIEKAVRQIVPRSEQEAKWQTVEQRFARIEADVRNIQDHAPHS